MQILVGGTNAVGIGDAEMSSLSMEKSRFGEMSSGLFLACIAAKRAFPPAEEEGAGEEVDDAPLLLLVPAKGETVVVEEDDELA